jgi:hypothetical protein
MIVSDLSVSLSFHLEFILSLGERKKHFTCQDLRDEWVAGVGVRVGMEEQRVLHVGGNGTTLAFSSRFFNNGRYTTCV